MGYVTAEKIEPSPIDMVGDMAEAISLEKRMGKSKSTLRDILGKVAASYNSMVTIKRHRIDSNKRSMLYNLLLGSSRLRPGRVQNTGHDC